MPQKAFDDLFAQIYQAAKQNMKLDLGWKNIIVNPEEQKMTAIDFFPDSDSLNRMLIRIVILLTGNQSVTEAQTKKIAGKVILSSLNYLENNQNRNPDFSKLYKGLTEELRKHGFMSLNYLKVLNTRLEDIANLSVRENAPDNTLLNINIKILRTLVQQLF